MAKTNNKDKQNSKLITNLDDQISKLKICLGEIKDTLNIIQKGDGSPYWNGTNAYNIIKNAMGQVDNDKILVDYINKCRQSIKK